MRFHVDDLMSSHKDKRVNDEFLKWLNDKYGEHGKVTATRGNTHDYLGITFEFGNGEVKVSMIDYIQNMLKEFPVKFKKGDTAVNPATGDMFKSDNSKKLNEQERELFHRFVAKALFLCKRARVDVQPIVAVLCTRVKSPGKNDWSKLVRMTKFLNGTMNDKLTLSAGKGVHNIEWYIDTAFAVHPDFKSHTGRVMMFEEGKGGVENVSTKQKLNTDSSTTAEVVGVHDVLPLVLWTKLFLEEQGYKVESNKVYQDNKSTILLAKNGKKSSSKRTRAINISQLII